MIYGYIRVSSDKQTTENQLFEIQNYTKAKGIVIDEYIEETISGIKKLEERKLNDILLKMRKDDVIIVTELSRLGRNLMGIMSILNLCMLTHVRVCTIKENYELGDNINSKVLAFAFGLSAEIERTLISQRTKEALARKKAEGVILGRPKGKKSKKLKLTGKNDKIQELLDAKVSVSAIGRILGVHRITVTDYIKNNNLEVKS
jgi:DNA invertase Pin-like site-specific DNA recombinase